MSEQTIYRLLKESLFLNTSGRSEHLAAALAKDWKPVFEEMKKQTVASLPGEWLKEHPLPGASQWMSYCVMQQAQWVRVMHAQKELLQLLDAHEIPCVILKGAAAAMAYPHPSLRSMGDVDFLVKRADFQRTAALLENNGYRLAHEKNESHHHYGYYRNGISFELHKRLAIIRQDDDRLIARFEKGIDQREYHETEGFSFPVLPAELNGLVLMFHINQHLRSGLGLRQIIDWMMYADRLPEDVWKDQVLPMLRETGMERLALTVTVMCQRYLGLRTIVETKNDALPYEALMNYIMERGNFGRKSGKKGKNATVFFGMKGPVRMMKRLQAGGMVRWKAARRHRVLRPFAWIYQSFRIAGIFMKNRVTPKQLREQREKGLEYRSLIESLGLNIDRYIR